MRFAFGGRAGVHSTMEQSSLTTCMLEIWLARDASEISGRLLWFMLGDEV